MKKIKLCRFSKKMMLTIISRYCLDFKERAINCHFAKYKDSCWLRGGGLEFYFGPGFEGFRLHAYTIGCCRDDPQIIQIDQLFYISPDALLNMGCAQIQRRLPDGTF